MRISLVLVYSMLLLSVGTVQASTLLFHNKTDKGIHLWIKYHACKGDHVYMGPNQKFNQDMKWCCLDEIRYSFDESPATGLLLDPHKGLCEDAFIYIEEAPDLNHNKVLVVTQESWFSKDCERQFYVNGSFVKKTECRIDAQF